MNGRRIPITGMNSGQRGVIVEINGGHGMVSRLAAMGVLPGKKITKVSAMMMKGPVTIEVDRAKIAIGFGMAQKIFIEPDR